MSERPFPPSARRRALAARAGLTAASPLLVGALAMTAAALAIPLAGGLARSLAVAVAAACSGRAVLAPGDLGIAVLAIIAPLLGAIALVAFAGHVAQTRTVWLPRRRVDGAPALAAGPSSRTRRAALDLGSVLVVGAVAFGWLWHAAPQLAALTSLRPADALGAAGALLGSAVATLAIAHLALGVVDALVRHVEVAGALAMTTAEKREDERLAAADPRWAKARARLARQPLAGTSIASTPLAASVAGAAVLVLGDDVAAAIAWDAQRRPVPMRVAVGRRAHATQLLGLARRHGIPVHRDAALADALAGTEGPVSAAHWPKLAQIIAAVRR